VKLVHADLLRYWIEPERTDIKSCVQGSSTQGVQWLDEGKLKPYINQIIKLEETENALL